MTLFSDLHAHPDPEAPVPTGPVDQTRESASPVEARLLCGTGPADWPRVAAAARHWHGTVPAFGLHPWHSAVAADTPHWLGILQENLETFPGAWLGEAGLDNLRKDIPSLEQQQKILTRQLALARDLGRPVNLHCVKAWDQLLQVLDDVCLCAGTRRFIVHSFAGPYQLVDELCRRGAFFTQGPLQAGRDSRKAQERARLIPLDRLVLETDAFLEPGRDEVDSLAATLAWLAQVREVPADELATQLLENSRRLLT